jgi:hypothetical protein
MRKSGFFLAWRSVWRHKAFKNVIESAIWLYMVSSASHKDKEARQLLSNSKVHQEVDKIEYKIVETWGDEDIVERDGKRYRRHRWKKIPMIPL